MKNMHITKIIVAFLISLTLTGCSFSPNSNIIGNSHSQADSQNGKLMTTDDSIITLDIYPEYSGYAQIGKFERFQFNNLNETQQSIYITLDNAIYKMQTGYISVGNCTYKDLELAYYALRCDRPEYFWIPLSYSLKTLGNSRKICFAKTEDDWTCSKETRLQLESQIKNILTEFCKGINKNLSQFDRELIAHDWLCKKITYDKTAITSPESNLSAWTIEGAFINNSAVCEGYSRAMQIMCYLLGIDCTTITGVTSEAHMWNCVQIEDEWYHLDITANDGDSKTFHSFFNVTEQYLLQSRTIDSDVENVVEDELEKQRFNYKLPNCTSISNNYHVKSSAYVANKNSYKSTMISLICNAARNKTRVVEIGFGKDLDFVYGRDSIDSLGNLKKIISQANAELDDNLKIKKYTYSGINGALGFMLSW